MLLANIINLAMAKSEYNVTYYDHNPGIHFEKLGEMRLYNNKWKIITFVNIDSLSDKFLSLNNYYTMTLNLCRHENAQYHYYICDSFVKFTKYNLNKINRELQVLHELVGHDIVSRNKRGWFDIIGKATKVLFGILDNDDAKYYDAKISEFSKDENSVINLLKEQTKIVQSTLINFNNTIGTLDFNENVLKGNIEKIAKELDKNQKDVKFLNLKTNLEDHVTITNMILNQLQLEIMSLTNAILIAKKGILHPAIMTPVQLTKELRQVLESLPHGLEFPIPLDTSNANILLNIIELQVFFENKRLIYIINTPLVETQLFYLYKISPFPKLVVLNEFILIQPFSKYIAIDESKQQFVQFSDMEYISCIKLLGNKIICKQHKPVSLAHLVDNCEIRLLQATSDKIPENCDKRIVTSKRGIFIQLSTSNTWIFAVPNTETLTISCTNNDKPMDVTLKNCGSVTLAKQCKAYSSSTILMPHDNIYQSEVYSEIVPPFDIIDECCQKVKEHQINFSEIVLNQHYKTLSKHIPELNIASHKLDDIEKLADDIHKNKATSRYTFSASILAYILAIIVLFYLGYKFYKKCICQKNKNSCCGIPNLCIRVNQNVQPSYPNNEYAARYINRNRAVRSTTGDDDSDEENVSLEFPQRKSIGYAPTRRAVK